MNKEIFIGLDVGTDSVGYAVTDTEYKVLKYKGEPMWGSTVFEEGNTKAERRGFRTARRRLDRRQQRIILTQDIFAKEIAKVDEKFFVRLKESGLYREDTSIDSTYFLFEDKYFCDKDYHKKYPTIHHLIIDLMTNKEPKDVRLVYLAVAWFMAHRGHFLNEVDKNNISKVLDFDIVYDRFMQYFEKSLWEVDKNKFKDILLLKLSVTRKEKEFYNLLNLGKKYKDSEEDLISKCSIVKLLSGGKVKPEGLFKNAQYKDIDAVSLGMPEENFLSIIAELDDDGELLIRLRELYDWAILADILAGEKTISAAKVKVYEQHKKDLSDLKKFVKEYIPQKYNLIFRDDKVDNYAAYSGNNSDKKCNKEAFCTFLLKNVKNISVLDKDIEFYESMINRLELRNFLPKQVDGDNRVIPYQLYYHELSEIIKNAKVYLPFINEKDEEGYTNEEKLISIFEFKIPYFVGPLRADNSKNSWIKRKSGAVGKIYPWNFYNMVDLDITEQDFINRMTNKCTYLPSEEVIPKCSLLYSKFMVLNEINNIKINGVDIPVDIKQQIFHKFKEYKKVSVKKINEVLLSNGCMKKGDIVSGLDETVKSSLLSYHAFKNMLEKEILTELEVEDIIKHMTYSEDKIRLKMWLDKNYAKLSDEDKKYILHLKFKDFGRLSEKFLKGIEGVDKKTGEIITIIDAMWNTNDNLMQILSDKYTFSEVIENERKEFYAQNDNTVDTILDNMYISNSVKRPIYRTLDILEDIKKATKTTPKRIFIEMARGGGEKGKRTKTRREQIQELYSNFDKQEVRELSKLLDDKTDNELQSEVYFLYFMQMGRCMYSGEAINIEELKTSKYNVDHIYPQSKVKDDSLTNKVLVLSVLNKEKDDNYPVPSQYRNKMSSLWAVLKSKGMISDEKYRRLMRNTSFSEEELTGFINRQLVETRQSTKALATILKRQYPDTEIVYVKAGLVSDFRKEFNILKSRQVNDLHHGKDAYLNIICGNVYHCKFTKNSFAHKEYSLKTKTIFTSDVYENKNLIWNGKDSIEKIKKIVLKNNLHYTRFPFERKGGLFDQNPVKAGKGAIPRKSNLPIAKYGGYNKVTASFFLLVKYKEKKKSDIMFMPVERCVSDIVMKSEDNVMAYAKANIANILGKQQSDINIISLPLGLRKLKINTALSLNGFRVAITGKANGGKILSITSMESLKINTNYELYIKRLERFVEKRNEKIVQCIDEKYDKITIEDNLKLYDLFLDKIQSDKFKNIFANNIENMVASRERFVHMSIEDQVIILMNILSVFKTGRVSGCDLRQIGGTENAAILTMSSKLSNWKKCYDDIRIIDISSSGIYEKQSENLLELL